MDLVRMGIVGSGYMGRTYAECLTKYNEGVRLVAITGGSRAEKLASDYSAEAVADFSTLAKRNDIDALLIATPHHLHAEQVIVAARQRKHVLLEKPMATNVADCDAMIAACKDAGVTLSVIKTLRYRIFGRAKRVIEDGQIGKVLMIQVTSLWAQGPLGKGWLNSPNAGGSLLDFGAHIFDLVRWLIADEPVRVCGSVGSNRGEAWRALSAMVQVDFANGASCQVWQSEELPDPGFPNTRYSIRVWGVKGIMECEGYGKLRIGVSGKWHDLWEQPAFDPVGNPADPVRLEAFYLQTQDFVDSVRFGRPPAVSGEDGRAAVEMVQAAFLSSLTGSTVHLPLPRNPGGTQFDGATVSREMIP